MSKPNVKAKVAHISSKTQGWDIAIADAQEMINELRERISRLNKAIRVFANMREKGEPFPR